MTQPTLAARRALSLSTCALLCALPLACSKGQSGSWLPDAKILVTGEVDNVGVNGGYQGNCRPGICQHNENTDMIVWNNAIYLIHRTAISQTLGPNASLHIYRSTDEGAHFIDVAQFLAPDATVSPPAGRDLRDPAFFIVGNELFFKALTRIPAGTPDNPGTGERDSGVQTQTVVSHSSDGVTWTPFVNVGTIGYSFWRVKEYNGVYYSAAYQDGDASVVLYSSTDGLNWTTGPLIYGITADTPLETELVFVPPPSGSPSGTADSLLALVRMDGTDEELLGGEGRLRTKVCTAQSPYTSFECNYEIDGERLDGPVAWYWDSRLFVIAREHIGADLRKRTTLFELTGDLSANMTQAPGVIVHAQFPSAGDTSYAGVAPLGGSRFLVSYYSSNLVADENWATAMGGPTDIWQATIDLASLPVNKVEWNPPADGGTLTGQTPQ